MREILAKLREGRLLRGIDPHPANLSGKTESPADPVKCTRCGHKIKESETTLKCENCGVTHEIKKEV